MTVLETERLKLREFSHADLDDFAALVVDEEQMRFYPRPKTKDEASTWINRNAAFYAECGYGFWLLESLATSEFLGYCGIRPRGAEIEIGWHTNRTR
jgi:RimJ/RimL family protein N-acetyltransferase